MVQVRWFWESAEVDVMLAAQTEVCHVLICTHEATLAQPMAQHPKEESSTAKARERELIPSRLSCPNLLPFPLSYSCVHFSPPPTIQAAIASRIAKAAC
jgi:hypothetical protein